MKSLAMVLFIFELLLTVSCATIHLGGNVYVKRSRQGDETPVVDMRNMESGSEIEAKHQLKKSWSRKETTVIREDLPAEGLVSPH